MYVLYHLGNLSLLPSRNTSQSTLYFYISFFTVVARYISNCSVLWAKKHRVVATTSLTISPSFVGDGVREDR